MILGSSMEFSTHQDLMVECRLGNYSILEINSYILYNKYYKLIVCAAH